MKITLLVHNLSSNSVTRVYNISHVLKRFSEVEIVGFVGPAGVFAPFRDELVCKSLPLPGPSNLRSAMKALGEMITGDVVWAFKANPVSYGVGLQDRRRTQRSLVLDIEDLDHAFQYTRPRRDLIKNSLMVWDHQSYLCLLGFQLLAGHADSTTVVSTYLQRRYGGVLVPHGVDSDLFNPALFDRDLLKKKWGTEGVRTILFAGKAAGHKGVKELAALIEHLDARPEESPVKLMMVGGSREDPLVQPVLEAGGDRVIHLPSQPHGVIPEILCQADLVVLPQKKSTYTEAQIPAKIYEAMAMAKPIVASAVSDLPLMLEEAGVVVPPGDTAGLVQAVQGLLDDSARAAALAANARARCVERYSWNAMETTLRDLFLPLARPK